MTPANLQNALIVRIEDALKDFPLKTTYNDHKAFKVFKQKVPEQLSGEFDYSEEGSDKALFPFCVVKLEGGTKQENHETQLNTVQLIIGVKNEDEKGAGFDDALACMEAITGNLNENPIVDKRYNLKYPLEWTTNDEDTHPYYYIGMEMKFESHTLTQQKGGFLHGRN